MLTKSRAMFAGGAMLLSALGTGTAATASEPMPVVATFSILGDLVHNVGQDHVAVTTLVGRDGDAHVFHPTPKHARSVGKARLVFVNGLGFEGWMDRLMESVDFDGTIVTVSDSIDVLKAGGHDDHQGHDRHDSHKDHDHGQKDDHGRKHDHDHKHDHKHDHDHKEDHAHKHDHGAKDKHAGHHDHHDHGEFDPHAWQDIASIKIYVANIADALSKADPERAGEYAQNRAAYAAQLDALDAELRRALAQTPGAPHRVAVPHDAFGYFARAYGVQFVALQGLSTESEVSANDVANLIREIRAEEIDAIFVENLADTRLIDQVQRETGVRMGGTLYSGALSGPDGPAATYLEMMRYNIQTLIAALRKD